MKIGRGNRNKNLHQRHFVHHKSHMTRPGFEPGPPRWEASDYPLELWRGLRGNVTHKIKNCVDSSNVIQSRMISWIGHVAHMGRRGIYAGCWW
jgi:hypothetical protein